MFTRKDIIKLAMPVIAEQAFIISMGVINTIMAGRIGKEAVSAIGMVDSINNFFIAFFSALALGGTVVVAHYIGQKNIVEANETVKQALFSGLIVSLLLTIPIWVFKIPIIHFLYGVAEPAVLNNATVYMSITLLTYPMIAITAIISGILRGAGDTKTPMFINIIMNIINIILSYLFIYGLDVGNEYFHFSIPGMKVTGAAIGIAIARVIGMSLFIYVLIKGSKIVKLSRIRAFQFRLEIQKAIFGIGIPASIESILFNAGKLITQIFIVGMGTIHIASNYITWSVFSLLIIPGSALSMVATTLVGQCMGAGEEEEAKKNLIYMTMLSSVCMLGISCICFPFAHGIASMYSQSEEIIELSANLIRQAAIAIPFLWSVSFVLPSGFKGAGDAKFTMGTSIISMWVFRVLLSYILAIHFNFGIYGIWVGMYCDWLVRGGIFCIRLVQGKWKNRRIIASI